MWRGGGDGGGVHTTVHTDATVAISHRIFPIRCIAYGLNSALRTAQKNCERSAAMGMHCGACPAEAETSILLHLQQTATHHVSI